MPMEISYKQHLSEIIEYFKENKNLVSFINSIVSRFLKYLIETLLEAKVEYERTKALIRRNWYNIRIRKKNLRYITFVF
ncbi:MAG: hypothetical protein HPY57_01600 [Ignavibacteria bacterium]|nr:hypothetical protein [Ignavibacteria bacterium]